MWNDGYAGEERGAVEHSTDISLGEVIASLKLPKEVTDHYRTDITQLLLTPTDIISYGYGLKICDYEEYILVTSNNYIIGVNYHNGRASAWLSHSGHTDKWDIDPYKLISDEGALHYIVTKYFYEENPGEYIGVYQQNDYNASCTYDKRLTQYSGDIMDKKKVFNIQTEEEFVNIVRIMCDLWYGDTYDDTRVTRGLYGFYSPITTDSWDVNIDDLSEEINKNVVIATSIGAFHSENVEALEKIGLLDAVEAIADDHGLIDVYLLLKDKGHKVFFIEDYSEYGSDDDGLLLWMTKESKLGNKKEGDK